MKIPPKIRFFLPVILWAGVIFAFSSYPTGTTTEIYWQDFIIKKMAHMVEYGVLTILSYRAFWNSGDGKRNAMISAVALAVFYAITDEIHQSFTPGREPRARDIIFDTIGALGVAFIIWKLLPIAPARLRRWAENFQLI
ncbi:hypothetical protein A2803_04555 [Candidatus Woesebacteria bacterium RIFCSPHIGHO2_01_FULL_44_21]|uniref:VanZ-like domain-containing protein n=1 Tax=Candidatus Woesebacteria bacterium RIFCSPHIGHO2_01_FULL_44_21 TaxID=1802503 RepID=A0A1F7YWE8_9BACT|nr:MAG: hypothetical protein A2803_04555 [Candidatus Woesebacteria bacterium RIFCSPHIGHO2_01_FULL_44_21]OGM71343.1 MAG: hypothetical protein A2897_00920 [Candidatus Woesebacteria bacterium RIFCSPLOWO2_01_FULL_44_24b]